MARKYRTWLMAVLVAIGCCGMAYAAQAGPLGSRLLYADSSVSERPLRLHVVANSDSALDQQIKLQVRDEVIGLLYATMESCADKQEAMRLVQAELPQITQTCNEYLAAQRLPYQAAARLETADFPEINYNGDIYAAGVYDALRIELGQAAGHNWWCVLFPPLCFVDLSVVEDDQAAVPAMSGSGDSGNGLRVEWKLTQLWAED